MTWSDFLLSFRGRIGRKAFWLYSLSVFVISLVFSFIDGLIGSQAISIAFGMLCLWPGLAINTKRWHDRGKSGWWNLIILIPFLGVLWALIECGFLRGTEGPNRFGDTADAPPAFA